MYWSFGGVLCELVQVLNFSQETRASSRRLEEASIASPQEARLEEEASRGDWEQSPPDVHHFFWLNSAIDFDFRVLQSRNMSHCYTLLGIPRIPHTYRTSSPVTRTSRRCARRWVRRKVRDRLLKRPNKIPSIELPARWFLPAVSKTIILQKLPSSKQRY